MGNRFLAKIVLACLGMIIIISLQGSPRIAQVLTPIDTARNPVNAVQAFFKAVERGDWLKARALTTRNFWNYLESNGQVTAWQNSLKQDSSLEFTVFTVQASEIDEQKAVLDGRAVWVSALGNVPRNAQTITLERGLGGWCISSILTMESTGVVESFYLYLSQGQWEKAKSLVQAETWRDWEKHGIIAKLKAGYGKKSPYVSAAAESVEEQTNQAQVRANLTWMISQEFKTQALVKLSKVGDKWVIRQVEGGWPK